MADLEMPDKHYLAAAIGWLELGNAAEAAAEFECVSPDLRVHPEVLEVRWIIAAERKDWPEGLKAAQSLVEHAPDRATGWLHRAYALRRVPEGGLKPAWDALLPASDKFPKEAIIPYNLSCYACQMQLLEDARTWFKRALAVGGKDKIKKMALADEDLKPLWREIGEM